MPKGRYEIMLRLHAARSAALGLDMMLRTCTIQANLDYSSEADMAKKFRVGLALQPLATALVRQFAVHRRQAQRLPLAIAATSGRTPIRTAPACCPSCSRTASAMSAMLDYALDVPMYFVFRDGQYIDVAGQSFRDFLDGRAARPARREAARIATGPTIFRPPSPKCGSRASSRCAAPMAGRWSRICALPALWVGLLYDERALDAAWDLVKDWTLDGAPGAARRGAAARRSTRRSPAAAPCATSAGACSTSPRPGLTARARLNAAGDNETGFLDPLREIVAAGKLAGRAAARPLPRRMGAATSAASTRSRASRGHPGGRAAPAAAYRSAVPRAPRRSAW